MAEAVQQNRVAEILGEYADELEEAASEADDQAAIDAGRVLAALARDENPPRDAARRVLERHGGT